MSTIKNEHLMVVKALLILPTICCTGVLAVSSTASPGESRTWSGCQMVESTNVNSRNHYAAEVCPTNMNLVEYSCGQYSRPGRPPTAPPHTRSPAPAPTPEMAFRSPNRECQISGNNCARLTSYYNQQSCHITINRAGTLRVTYFSVERSYDFLRIAGRTIYENQNRVVSAGQRVTWDTDYSVTQGGWTICIDPPPSRSPSVSPTSTYSVLSAFDVLGTSLHRRNDYLSDEGICGSGTGCNCTTIRAFCCDDCAIAKGDLAAASEAGVHMQSAGRCGQPLQTIEACNAAAVDFGWTLAASTVSGTTGAPPYCYLEYGVGLRFNGNFSSSVPCSYGKTCLCAYSTNNAPPVEVTDDDDVYGYALNYMAVTASQCTNPITTLNECTIGAALANVISQTAIDDGQNGTSTDPPFCYVENGRLKFNADGRNSGNCSRIDICVCVAEFNSPQTTVLPTQPTSSAPTIVSSATGTTSISTSVPSATPTGTPSVPTGVPSATPTGRVRTCAPTVAPTVSPTTSAPSISPTQSPTVSPSEGPTTSTPTTSPTISSPTTAPTISPTVSIPTVAPTHSPTPASCSLATNLGQSVSPLNATTTEGSSSVAISCNGQRGTGSEQIFFADVPAGYVVDVRKRSGVFDTVLSLGIDGSCPGDTIVDCTTNRSERLFWYNNRSSTARVFVVVDSVFNGATFVRNGSGTSSNVTVDVQATETQCRRSSVMSDESDCQASSIALGYTWSSAGSWAQYPSGCFVLNQVSVYFNSHITGAASRVAQPICQIRGRPQTGGNFSLGWVIAVRTARPTVAPSYRPTARPTSQPSKLPTTTYPTRIPTISSPSASPTTSIPTIPPTVSPTISSCSLAQDLSTLTSPFTGNSEGGSSSLAMTCGRTLSFPLSGRERVFYKDVLAGELLSLAEHESDFPSALLLRWGGSCPGQFDGGCSVPNNGTGLSFLNDQNTAIRAYVIVDTYSSAGLQYQHRVVSGNFSYSTLTNTDPNSSLSSDGQTGMAAPREGCELAPNTPTVRQIVAQYFWGVPNMVLDSGVTVGTKLSATPGNVTGTDNLVVLGSLYLPRDDEKEVLVRCTLNSTLSSTGGNFQLNWNVLVPTAPPTTSPTSPTMAPSRSPTVDPCGIYACSKDCDGLMDTLIRLGNTNVTENVTRRCGWSDTENRCKIGLVSSEEQLSELFEAHEGACDQYRSQSGTGDDGESSSSIVPVVAAVAVVVALCLGIAGFLYVRSRRNPEKIRESSTIANKVFSAPLGFVASDSDGVYEAEDGNAVYEDVDDNKINNDDCVYEEPIMEPSCDPNHVPEANNDENVYEDPNTAQFATELSLPPEIQYEYDTVDVIGDNKETGRALDLAPEIQGEDYDTVDSKELRLDEQSLDGFEDVADDDVSKSDGYLNVAEVAQLPCAHRSKKGRPCPNPVIPGGVRCVIHTCSVSGCSNPKSSTKTTCEEHEVANSKDLDLEVEC